MGLLSNAQRGKKMLYKDEDKVWGTDYTVADVKVLMAQGAVPTNFIKFFLTVLCRSAPLLS